MKLYIYEYADCDVTNSYHAGGGVIICTAGDPQEAWDEYAKKEKLPQGNLGTPDRAIKTTYETPAFITVFPDVGCC